MVTEAPARQVLAGGLGVPQRRGPLLDPAVASAIASSARSGRRRRWATQDYYERRIKEGKTRRDIVRCLKRYAAREVFHMVGQLLPGHSSRSTTSSMALMCGRRTMCSSRDRKGRTALRDQAP